MNHPGIQSHSLPNGLRVVHSYDTSTAMVAVDVLYDVGSRDESRQLTGIAHLFEHLMFGGSASAPSFDCVLEYAGGKSNAWTSSDFTNFYDVLPAQNIDTALFLESDRMARLTLDSHALEVQRAVVTEEFKQTHLDQPYGDLFHHLRRICYAESHPYSWPTIGLEPEHIARVTLGDARRWYNSHYSPGGAILAVCGAVDFDTVVRRAEYWWADVPARPTATRHIPSVTLRADTVVETVTGAVPDPYIVVAYPMGAYSSHEYHAADTITDILSVGRTARINNDLINGHARGMMIEADASVMGSEHEGLLLLTARLTAGADPMQAATMLRAQLERMATPGDITARELERTQHNFEATYRLTNQSYLTRATNMALAAYHGESLTAAVDIRARLTPADIASTAAAIASRHPAILIYLPRE